MSNDDIKPPHGLIQSLSEHRAFFSTMRDIGEHYTAQAEAARKALEAKAAINNQINEGTHRSLAKAEIGMQELAEQFLGGK